MKLQESADTKILQVEAAVSNGVESLKNGIFSILRAVESLESTLTTTTKSGIDFRDEVKRFEISLIRRALKQADGNQARAALFLNMKKTTLYCKIKQYQITVDDLEEV